VRSSPAKFQVEHECPQCGGPVTIEETDRILSCAYCRVHLFIDEGPFFRYVIPPREVPAGAEIFHVPYWRFRGMQFSVRPFQAEARVMDATFQAAPLPFVPETLGVRPQTQRLRFSSPELPGVFLASRVPIEDVPARVEALAATHDMMAEAPPPLHRAFVGETVSMVYAPFYFKGSGLFDAVVNRPIRRKSPEMEDAVAAAPRNNRKWRVRFLPSLCPDCGGDLAASRSSIVLLCPNCDAAWNFRRGAFRKIAYGVAPSPPSSPAGVVHLPFWRISVRLGGDALATLADLIRTLNLPKAVMPEHERKRAYVWLPAFEASPETVLRIARILTALQPEGPFEPRSPSRDGRGVAPVALPMTEAAEAIVSVLAETSSAKRRFIPQIATFTATPARAYLVYLPFRRTNTELIEANHGFRVPLTPFRTLVD
jgi:predicted RNA-binding Zn-ribbon protein involved in translation (DUF1610 family)